jgi:hypothetical protein
MKFSFHPDAERELIEAVNYYNISLEGLGNDFSLEVYFSIQRIITYPHAWQAVTDNTRRCLVSRFPYGIIYNAGNDAILIVAVMHLHKHPDYWKTRI